MQVKNPQTSGGIPVGTLVEEWSGFLEVPTDKSFTITLFASFAGVINLLKIITASGTCTAAVKINGTNVTGISAVAVTSTIATGTSTAANAFAVGDLITLVISASSTPIDLAFTLKYTR